ncbi:MAG: type II toxin-antitoxin system HicA family toxin [Candidatus Aenigmarchaeota archaeon]|nr:type II toxin-antitoxin system HicA family toxin [Candidatus Aenigmarchaeota archaeon]
MSKLPVVSDSEMIKFLSKNGFSVLRQRGSHVSLYKKINGKSLLVIVPMKNEIKKGTMLSILKQSNISREKFLKYFG